jgi:ribonuclease BN (tRNA processing enzyme)
MIEFHVLGSGASVPSPGHGQPAHWVVVDGRSLLIDPGPGALVRLVNLAAGPGNLDGIDTVLFTHLHIDHCADLAPLLFALHTPVPESTRPLQLIGPQGLAAHLEQLRDMYGDWLTPARRSLVVTEITAGETLEAGPRPDDLWSASAAGDRPHLAAFAAEHPQSRPGSSSLLYRLADATGHRVTYSGDTEPCAGLSAASEGVDLLVVECSTPDALAMAGHMTPERVGHLCAASHPRRVVLVHLYPPAAALDLPALVGRHFSGPVHVARDGDGFRVPESASPLKERT